MNRLWQIALLCAAAFALAMPPARARDAATLDAVIDPAHFRGDLAARALLEESNRQRVAAGLPPLAFLAAAQTAAQWQAQFMAQSGTIGHVNTADRRYRNLEDRVRAAGVPFRFIAENVAMNFLVDYQPHRQFYTRRGPKGELIYSYAPNGPPLAFHTYASLARAVVVQWLASPPHRANLLSRDAQNLGCAAAVGTQDRAHGLGNVYCAQVFVTPR